VRAIDIHTLLAGLVRILKYVGLAIGDVFPEWEIGITDSDESGFLLGFLLAGTRGPQHHTAYGCKRCSNGYSSHIDDMFN
jgi:hypothetical protein